MKWLISLTILDTNQSHTLVCAPHQGNMIHYVMNGHLNCKAACVFSNMKIPLISFIMLQCSKSKSLSSAGPGFSPAPAPSVVPPCNTYRVYLTCAVTKTRKVGETEWNILLPNGVEWIWTLRFKPGQPHRPTMISPCPQCFLGKWSAVNWFSVSLYICLHINRHLPKKPTGKSPLDYYETVARLNVVTKQHNTLFTS